MNYSKSTKLDKEALKRDNFKCQGCGETEFLEVHHKIPNLETLDNLITFCHACHKKEHNMVGCYGYGREGIQTEEFKNNQKLGHIFFGNQHTK